MSFHSLIAHFFLELTNSLMGFPGGSEGKETACNAGDDRDMELIPGWGRCPGGGHDNPLQYSCLGNTMDREAWQTRVHRVAKNWTWLKQLSSHTESNQKEGKRGKLKIKWREKKTASKATSAHEIVWGMYRSPISRLEGLWTTDWATVQGIWLKGVH